MDKPVMQAIMCFGHMELRSWIEYQDGKLVGMGSATCYDREGKIESHKVEPTGIEIINASVLF